MRALRRLLKKVVEKALIRLDKHLGHRKNASGNNMSQR